MVIGIAGYMGSGKSTLAKLLNDQIGGTLLDGDKLARELMLQDQTIIDAIGVNFGAVENNQINFQQLGKRVFEDKNALLMLNSIVHPPLISLLNESISSATKLPVIIDAALLPLWQANVSLDLRLWIDASIQCRIDRVVGRTLLGYDEVEKRILGQMELFSTNESWQAVDNERAVDETLVDIFATLDL